MKLEYTKQKTSKSPVSGRIIISPPRLTLKSKIYVKVNEFKDRINNSKQLSTFKKELTTFNKGKWVTYKIELTEHNDDLIIKLKGWNGKTKTITLNKEGKIIKWSKGIHFDPKVMDDPYE